MKDGGPAFPMHGNEFHNGTEGMTLRDWLAGMALSGWIAGPLGGDTMEAYEGQPGAFHEHTAAVAEACYSYADAMLAAREKKASGV